MKTLRIVFCILSCLCVAAIVPAAVFLEWYCLFFVLGAAAFGLAMLFVKRASEPKQETTDFMNSEEQNAEIIRNRDEQDK